MMRHEQAIREEIVRIATRCYERGLLVAGDGPARATLERQAGAQVTFLGAVDRARDLPG